MQCICNVYVRCMYKHAHDALISRTTSVSNLNISYQFNMKESYALIDEDGILSWDDTTDDEYQPQPRAECSAQDSAQPSNDSAQPSNESWYCDQYLSFTDQNPTTFHVVEYFRTVLEQHGFEYVDEAAPITPEFKARAQRGGKFYTIRGGLTILPFVLGGKWAPQHGAAVVGSHIDAITVKLRPSSAREDVDGYQMLGVAGYSGGLKGGWLDRDLGLGGAILVEAPAETTEPGPNGASASSGPGPSSSTAGPSSGPSAHEPSTTGTGPVASSTTGTESVPASSLYKRVLVKSPGPVAKIPSLAPHFHHETAYNPETELVPIVGFKGPAELALALGRGTGPEGKGTGPDVASADPDLAPLVLGGPAPLARHEALGHSPALLAYLSSISSIPVHRILDLDLELYDTQAATRGGLDQEFIFAPRLDDRLCSFTAIHALLRFCSQFSAQTLATHPGLTMVVLVDNEEIGSGTRTGVKGKLLNSTIQNILTSIDSPQNDSLVYANSVILSADVTHLMNPNFRSSYLSNHYPLPNIGVSVKLDPNGHVATDSVGVRMLKNITARNGLQLQQFHIRNDGRSGGTIGPQLAVDTGARVVDVGIPILSMHSVRAVCGYKDVWHGVKFFEVFFGEWRGEYNKFKGL